MTKEELKNEVEIQNLLKTSTLANDLKHNINCIEQTTVDEKIKEKLLNEIKKEFASKSLYLRKQLEIVLNEIENAKNLDNIVIDDLFKKAQIQIEEEEKQQKLAEEKEAEEKEKKEKEAKEKETKEKEEIEKKEKEAKKKEAKEKEIKEKIKEKQKTNEVLTKLKNKINTSELENDYLQNIYDNIEKFKDEDIKKELYDAVNSMVSKLEKFKANNNNKKDSKTKIELLNKDNVNAKGANKLTFPKVINKIKKAYNSFINNTTKENNSSNTNTKENTQKESTQKENTQKENTQKESTQKENTQKENTQNNNKQTSKRTKKNATKNNNSKKNKPTIEMDPVHKAIQHSKSKEYQDSIKSLLELYEEIEPYYGQAYNKKKKTEKENNKKQEDKTENENKTNTKSNKKEEKLSTNNTKLNGGISVGKIPRILKKAVNFFKNDYSKNLENTSTTKTK